MDTIEREQRIKTNLCEALQIIGAKWAFLVIGELGQGPKRFKQLQRDAALIKTQSLTDILRQLEQTGLVRREVFPTVPVTVEYSLTKKGNDFQKVLQEMDRWAVKWADAVSETDANTDADETSEQAR